MLNDKQDLFCHEYIIDQNATQAAIRAGYSERSARSVSSRLLTNDNIRARIDELLADIKSQKIADATEVLETLTTVLRREAHENVVVTVKKKRSYYDDNGKKVTEEQEEGLVVEIPTRISDVNKAGELLARKYGLLNDGQDSNVPVTVVINYDYGGED